MSNKLPLGFKINGINCGIKKKDKDLGLIYSEVISQAVGAFTANKIKAAPVKLSKQRLKNKKARAVIVNSGNANCLTGKDAIESAVKMTSVLAKELALNKNDILVASTGKIGVKLPVDKITKAVSLLVKGLARDNVSSFAQAIMTTDKSIKVISKSVTVGNSKITITGFAKGAGMIAPGLATMLSFIITDINIDYSALKKAFKKAVDNSFNRISVDGDMSTNDTALILANGLAQNHKLNLNSKDFSKFYNALNFICVSLAKMIVIQGEGAKKIITVNVKGAKTNKQADNVARKVINSPLVKTAIAGCDPNWGRIASSAGAAEADLNEDKMDIYLQDKLVLSKGKPGKNNNYSLLHKLLKKKSIKIVINLNKGKAEAYAYGCDLTEGYVKLNARYEI